ncbi:MAG: hypothetical protein R3A45_05925 [Bdellovibrionota bacterium]
MRNQFLKWANVFQFPKGQIFLNYNSGNPREFLMEADPDSLSTQSLRFDRFGQRSQTYNPFWYLIRDEIYNLGILYLFSPNHEQWAMIEIDGTELLGLTQRIPKKILACHGFTEKDIQEKLDDDTCSLGDVKCTH